MPPTSTTKKIQRVQRSGVSRRVGQRRPMAFSAAVVGIIVVGVILVLLARDARVNAHGDQPRANRDRWFQAYGLYQCDSYLANPPAPEQEADISTLGNGLISIFPLSEETAGDNARMGKFFESLDMKVTDTSVTTADGTELKAGDACGAGKNKTTDTVIRLFVWPPQASNKTEPEVIDDDFASVRFRQDGGAYALALVPESTTTIDLPGSVSNLSDPEGTAPAPVAPAGTTDTTAVEIPIDETTAPATETTEPAAETTAPPTTEG